MQDGKRLVDVPTWEGVLQYDPEDIRADRPLTFYRTRRRRAKDGRMVTLRYPLAVEKEDSQVCQRRKKGYNFKPKIRRRLQFVHKGENTHLYCSYLTVLAVTGFAVVDRRHWVVDHINNDCTDDRPSNLQVISQRENCRRSKEIMESIKKARQRQAELRAARRAEFTKNKQNEQNPKS